MIASPNASHRLLMSYSAPLGPLGPLGQFGQSGPFVRQAQRPAVDAAMPRTAPVPARPAGSGSASQAPQAAVERLPSPAAAGLGATAAVGAVACLAAIGGLGVAMAAWAWSLISHWLWAAAMAQL